MLNIKVLGALVACALIVAVPSLAHGGPVVGHPLAKGTMQATTINAQAGSMIFEKITIAPGGSFGWHTHTAPVAVAVAAGTLTVFDPTVNSCAPFKVSKGAVVRRAREPRASRAQRRQEARHGLRGLPRRPEAHRRGRRSNEAGGLQRLSS